MFDEVRKMLETKEQAILDEVCNLCGEPVLSFRDKKSLEEYHITAMCQNCQDKFFEPDPYEEDADEV